MRSDKLPHFPEYDPPPKNYLPEKVALGAEIAAQIAAFQAGGGEIQEVDSAENRNPVFIVNDVVRAG